MGPSSGSMFIFGGVSYGGFLKWWYPTTMGFPTKIDHVGVFWAYHHLRKHPYILFYLEQDFLSKSCVFFLEEKYFPWVMMEGNSIKGSVRAW